MKYINPDNNADWSATEEYSPEADERLDENLDIAMAELVQCEHDNRSVPGKHSHPNKMKPTRRQVLSRVAAIAAVVTVGIGVWALAGRNSDGPSQAGIGSTGNRTVSESSQTGKNDVGYSFTVGNIPDEWQWSKDGTLTLEWDSDAPLQQIDYTLVSSNNMETKHHNCKDGHFTIQGNQLAAVELIYYTISIGGNKDGLTPMIQGRIKVNH